MSQNPDPSHGEIFPFLARLEISREWEIAADSFLTRPGPVMVLGAPDTGKSTLCRYLLYRAYTAGLKTAWVDLDAGQSHLGPPTTLGLDFFPPRLPGDRVLSPTGLYFIGQTSPVGAILEVVVGCRVLADQARERGVFRVVVNTSGFVQGPGALKLKRSQVELLNPALILALQRDGELEPLLRGLGAAPGGGETDVEIDPSGWPIRRLPVSSRAMRRSPEERRHFREERFRRYFQQARRLNLPWPGLVIEGLPLGSGEPLEAPDLARFRQNLGGQVLYGESQGSRVLLLVAEPPPAPPDAGPVDSGRWEHLVWLSWSSLHFRLVGLLDGKRRTLALGLILPAPWTSEALALWTPLAPVDAPRVRCLKVGKIKVNLEGRELSHV